MRIFNKSMLDDIDTPVMEDFVFYDASKIDFSGFIFRRCRFFDKLTDLTFRSAMFEDVIFGRNPDRNSKSSSPYELSRCDFTGCTFENVSFTTMELRRCVFDDAVFENCIFNYIELFPRFMSNEYAGLVEVDPECPSFQRAHMTNVRIVESNLAGDWRGSTLCRCEIRHSRFLESIFLGAALQENTITDSTFWNSNMTGTDLSMSRLERVNLEDTKLVSTDFKGVKGVKLKFRNNDLSSPSLEGALFLDPEIGDGVVWPKKIPDGLFGGRSLRSILIQKMYRDIKAKIAEFREHRKNIEDMKKIIHTRKSEIFKLRWRYRYKLLHVLRNGEAIRKLITDHEKEYCDIMEAYDKKWQADRAAEWAETEKRWEIYLAEDNAERALLGLPPSEDKAR